MAAIDKRTLIANHPLFKTLSSEIVERIVALGVTERRSNGSVLFMKGDEGDALYGVLQGKIRISVSAPSGKEVTLNTMEAGDVFGEIALLDGKPRTADAITESTTELLVIHRRDFMDYLQREPRLSTHLLELLCERVRKTSELVEDAAFLNLPARLAKRLLVIGDLYGKETEEGVRIGIKLSQREIAQMMSASRESVNKNLQSWRKEGWIELARGTVVIRDPDALQQVVEAGLDGDF